jgi:hypothetical protein
MYVMVLNLRLPPSCRRQQELEAAGIGPGTTGEENPALMAELRALRQRKDELESHLGALQDSRRQLMVQLEGLMKLLKVCVIYFILLSTNLFCMYKIQLVSIFSLLSKTESMLIRSPVCLSVCVSTTNSF